jgi:hypothetical protein
MRRCSRCKVSRNPAFGSTRFRSTYLESIDKQQRIRVDRQIAIADISHRSDRHKRKAHGYHAIAEEPAPTR